MSVYYKHFRLIKNKLFYIHTKFWNVGLIFLFEKYYWITIPSELITFYRNKKWHKGEYIKYRECSF